MSIQTRLMEWAERQAKYREGHPTKYYSPFVCHIMNMFDKRVRLHEKKGDDYICKWEAPFGFVPECGCPFHG